jgi:hypothetical protein
MKEQDWKYIVDVLLFICLGGMTLIGIVMGFVVPTGPASPESSKYFLGLHRHQWGNIHAYLSIAFVILTVVHIVLNWKWITAKTSQIFKKKAAPVLVSAAVVPFLVLLVFWLFTPKDAEKYQEFGREAPGIGRWQEPDTDEKAPIAGETAAGRKIRDEGAAKADSPPRHGGAVSEDHRAAGSLVITGQLTLYDIERATGLSARSVADRLGLPSSAPLNERLGRLRRLYGIEIETVRDLVDRMLKE